MNVCMFLHCFEWTIYDSFFILCLCYVGHYQTQMQMERWTLMSSALHASWSTSNYGTLSYLRCYLLVSCNNQNHLVCSALLCYWKWSRYFLFLSKIHVVRTTRGPRRNHLNCNGTFRIQLKKNVCVAWNNVFWNEVGTVLETVWFEGNLLMWHHPSRWN